MKELKCPKCGYVFQVDEADYASIVNQVKNAEFEAELSHRLAELEDKKKAEQQLLSAKAEQDFQKQLAQKEKEVEAKKVELEQLKSQKETELLKVKTDLEAEIVQLKAKLENSENQKQSELAVAVAQKDLVINDLQAKISQNDNKLELAIQAERSKAQQSLQLKIDELESKKINVKQTVNLSKKWKTSSFEEKRGVCKILINRIVIDKDGNAEIIWNI